VHAREEERRHLRRDLHDDLAPTFAGLGLAAAAVREYSLAADERAAEAAGELIAGIAAATRQIREIAYDLRPPVLDERGLVAAVRDRVAGDALPPVTVVAPERRLVLPAAVESAALRIVQEAVVNVRRHAAASRCTVSIERREHALAVEIADDGRGMPPVPRDGIGLRSMRERAAELGGGLEIERLAPGTRVFVLLPLPTEAER
jgi:signal transduction histidine kinase